MSDKFASTTSLLSSHTSTLSEPKKSGLRGLFSSQKPKTAKDETPAGKVQQQDVAWSDSKFADMAAKNGWSSPTPTRPSF